MPLHDLSHRDFPTKPESSARRRNADYDSRLRQPTRTGGDTVPSLRWPLGGMKLEAAPPITIEMIRPLGVRAGIGVDDDRSGR